MNQKDLFGRGGVGTVRDEKDRHFTPYPLAVLICSRLRALGHNPRRVLEPSCGDGAFIRAVQVVWPHALTYGVDIDPKAVGLKYADVRHTGDFLQWDAPKPFDLVLGNPPFTGATAIDHVEKAKSLGEAVCLILPWGPLGGVEMWSSHMDGEHGPSEAWPIRPRPWPKHVRETAAYLWTEEDKRGTMVEWMPRWK